MAIENDAGAGASGEAKASGQAEGAVSRSKQAALSVQLRDATAAIGSAMIVSAAVGEVIPSRRWLVIISNPGFAVAIAKTIAVADGSWMPGWIPNRFKHILKVIPN